MNINNRFRAIAYLSIFFLLLVLLIREYTYIHPYNTGYGWLGPGWTYISTKTFTLGFIFIGALVLVTPVFRGQRIGLLGLLLLAATVLRPFTQDKFPCQTAFEFYNERKIILNEIVNRYKYNRDTTITSNEITDLDLTQLDIKDGICYFLLYDSDISPQGICYDKNGNRPDENFGRPLKYVKLDNNWYEFDHRH